MVLFGISFTIQAESTTVSRRDMEQRTELNLSGTGVLGSARGCCVSGEALSSELCWFCLMSPGWELGSKQILLMSLRCLKTLKMILEEY